MQVAQIQISSFHLPELPKFQNLEISTFYTFHLFGTEPPFRANLLLGEASSRGLLYPPSCRDPLPAARYYWFNPSQVMDIILNLRGSNNATVKDLVDMRVFLMQQITVLEREVGDVISSSKGSDLFHSAIACAGQAS